MPSIRLLICLFCVAFSGCNIDYNENSTHDSSHSGLEVDINWYKLSEANNPYQLREEIYDLTRDVHPSITNGLVELWNAENLDFYGLNEELVRHPAARLMIAQALAQRNIHDQTHYEYIIRFLDVNDKDIQLYALEALRDVNSVQALRKLELFADSKNLDAAEIAISGIAHSTQYGRFQNKAIAIWNKIKHDENVSQELIRTYLEMYFDNENYGSRE